MARKELDVIHLRARLIIIEWNIVRQISIEIDKGLSEKGLFRQVGSRYFLSRYRHQHDPLIGVMANDRSSVPSAENVCTSMRLNNEAVSHANIVSEVAVLVLVLVVVIVVVMKVISVGVEPETRMSGGGGGETPGAAPTCALRHFPPPTSPRNKTTTSTPFLVPSNTLILSSITRSSICTVVCFPTPTIGAGAACTMILFNSFGAACPPLPRGSPRTLSLKPQPKVRCPKKLRRRAREQYVRDRKSEALHELVLVWVGESSEDWLECDDMEEEELMEGKKWEAGICTRGGTSSVCSVGAVKAARRRRMGFFWMKGGGSGGTEKETLAIVVAKPTLGV
ncbi:hypothetical protein BDQ12DRAFT_713264 [Crucibulum laeve]|uniref:Uncharacterized protein n=1 Tax=Crucibulum laeve TaxID=68775 RepID=A0A5C3LY56_9AGAR|nr:hypothetical protein BDQ12DRAFT_713264 [Crucibulum laeve]